MGFVIQATGTVEFEDGLRTGVLPGGHWGPLEQLHLAEDKFKLSLGVWVGLGVSIAVIGTLLSEQISILLSSAQRWF